MLTVLLTLVFTLLYKVSYQANTLFSWDTLNADDKAKVTAHMKKENWILKNVTSEKDFVNELCSAIPVLNFLSYKYSTFFIRKILVIFFSNEKNLEKFLAKETFINMSNKDLKLITKNFSILLKKSLVEVAKDIVIGTKFSPAFILCEKEEFDKAALAAGLDGLSYKKFTELQCFSLEAYLQAFQKDTEFKTLNLKNNNKELSEASLYNEMLKLAILKLAKTDLSIFQEKNTEKELFIEKSPQHAMQSTNFNIANDKKAEINGSLAIFAKGSVFACLATAAFLLF